MNPLLQNFRLITRSWIGWMCITTFLFVSGYYFYISIFQDKTSFGDLTFDIFMTNIMASFFLTFLTIELIKKPFIFMLPSYIRKSRKFVFTSAIVFNILIFLLIVCIILIRGSMPVEDLANSWILPPTGILIFIVMVYSYSSRSGTITIFALCLYLGFSNDNMKNINTLYDIFIVRFPLVMILIDLGILLLVWKVVGERRYLRNAYLYLNRKKAGSYQKGESGIIEQYFIELLQRCRIANIRNILGAIYELPLFAGVSSLKNVGMFFILIPAVILLFSGYFMQNKKDVDYFLPVVILAGVIWVGCTHLLFKFKFFPAQSRKEKPKIAISASLVMTTLLCIYIFFLNFIISEIFPYFPVISYQGQNFEFSCPLNYTIALLPMFIYPIVGTVSLVARIISPRHQTYMEMGVFMLFCFGYIPIIIFSGCHFSDINQLIYFSPAVWIFFLILLNYYYSLADLVGQSEEKLQ